MPGEQFFVFHLWSTLGRAETSDAGIAKVRYRRQGVIRRAASESPLFEPERSFVVEV